MGVIVNKLTGEPFLVDIGEEDAIYEDLPVAASISITATKKRHYRSTTISTATDITTITLTDFTNGKSIDWYLKNSSLTSRSITLPAGVYLDEVSKAKAYYATATRIITLADTEELKITFKQTAIGTRVSFTKIVAA